MNKEEVEVFHAELDGRPIAFSNHSRFLVQVGKGTGAYRTKYTITGSLAQAVHYYRGVNIGNGYKKRLYAEGFRKPVLARAFS